MAGLSSIVNLGYHGTIPERAASIAASGFKGGIGQSSQFLGMNTPSWGGTGKVYTSTPNVASTYGSSKIPVIQSAKHLKVPGGGIPGKTFTEALQNIGKTKFGFETALSPEKATQGMTALERMKGKYPHSQTLKRLLKTGTTAITNPTNWARLLGLPLSALTGILSSTPANAGEQEWIDMMNERWSKNYGPWTQGTPHMQNQRFRQQQLMNQRRLAMQQQIQQAEAIEAAKQKITTGGPPSILSRPTPVTTGGPPSILSRPTPPVTTAKGPPSILSRPPSAPTGTGGPPSIISRPAPSAPTRTGGPPSRGGRGGGPPSQGGGSSRGGGGQRGRNPFGYRAGGLIDFYRYGGFVG